ncbi:winged helix-turn-helix domain-containing protein/riboflavin kinase [uncultured Methanomethylovorans sp.]|uniref:winged helix-turn-helix domain-containing protein/riboflavin kinase n=1 Tax=uncultured Methanomethylovorans sp. TaxID=183759 RepID=UPI00262653BE|nr:winged helix-turn-helix domain-containing protein/riboflavin kinase [uncultured Methanomethylovorans sp.]
MYAAEPLKKLALLGATDKHIKISSAEFAQYTTTSSKTTARLLKQLEDDKYIERQLVPGGQKIILTCNGIDLLRKEYAEYQRIFCRDDANIELHGKVIAGLGEGQYYIAQHGYMSQFSEKLGFHPFPGTLNIKLNEASVATRQLMECTEPVLIEGFNDKERTFGAGKCYPIRINGTKSAVIIPERTHYPANLLEIIAPVNLREKLHLIDGEEVKIVVEKKNKCEG